MDELPRNPDEFAYAVANLLSGIRPGSKVSYAGDLNLRIDGYNHDLSNLYKAVTIEPGRGAEIVIEHFEKLLNFSGDEFNIDTSDFLDVVGRIMPRILSDEYIDSMKDKRMVTAIPWINGCSISFVIDYPQFTISIRQDMMEDWGIKDPEDLYSFSLKNLWSTTRGIEFNIADLKDDKSGYSSKACYLYQCDGYDSSRVLLPQMYRSLAPVLGESYYVAIPSRDVFLAVSNECPQTIINIQNKIAQDYLNLPHPVCPELFLCVRDGVAPGTLEPL